MIRHVILAAILVTVSSSSPDNRTLPDGYSSVQEEVKILKGEVQTLTRKIKRFSQYCQLFPKNPCGSCECVDDKRLPKKYFCDCQLLSPKRDCLEFHQQGYRVDGIYKVHQNHMKIIQVFCDQNSDGGGWTVIQRRRDGSVNFYRDWKNYKNGFGDLQTEFWIGNENLFTMTLQALYPSGSQLRVELEDWEGGKRYAKYRSFQVGNEATMYQMHVSGYSGNAGDGGRGMTHHDGMKFSTFDRDNDIDSRNCAATYKGGWWYNNCHLVNLNGRYYNYAEMGATATGIHWWPFHGHSYSLKVVEMKMRRTV